MDLTVPLASTNASSLTVPVRFMVRAIDGYPGTTLLITFRADGLPALSAVCASAGEAARIAAKPSRKTSRAEPSLITTNLSVSLRGEQITAVESEVGLK